MRQIEHDLRKAISSKAKFKKSNTQIRPISDHVIGIYLHNNLIAELDYRINTLKIFSAGYKTNTTKSRLNALLWDTPYGVVQKKFKWYITNKRLNFSTADFSEGLTIFDFKIL